MNLISLPASQFPVDLRDTVEQNLSKTESVFANLDKGAGLPLSGFDMGVTNGIQVCRTRLNSVQGTVLLSSLRTLDLIRRQDGDAAAKSIISTIKLLRVFDMQPTMVVYGRKMINVGLVCNDIQMLIMYCRPSEEQLEKMQSAMEELFRSDCLEKMLLAERVYQLEIARNFIPKGIASKYLTANLPPMPERRPPPDFTWHRFRISVYSVRYLRDMAWTIAASRRPWPESLNEIADANATHSRKSTGHISTVALLSRLTAETLALTRSTTTAVAIERYRRQQGRIPDSLDDIRPRCISSIPLDPFSGLPLFYTHNDKSYTVYSTGSNRVDNGGVLAPDPNLPGGLDVGIRITRPASQ